MPRFLRSSFCGLVLAILVGGSGVAEPRPAPGGSCAYDKAAMMAMDQNAFDQGPDGWRRLDGAACPGVAADLIRDYRQTRQLSDGILFWHEGQLRASAGDYPAAEALLERSRRAADDTTGWNPYLDATLAFLRRDRAALANARAALVATPKPDWYEKSSGEMVAKFGRVLPWPLNLDVVDGLTTCFERPYSEAYGCRPAPAPKP